MEYYVARILQKCQCLYVGTFKMKLMNLKDPTLVHRIFGEFEQHKSIATNVYMLESLHHGFRWENPDFRVAWYLGKIRAFGMTKNTYFLMFGGQKIFTRTTFSTNRWYLHCFVLTKGKGPKLLIFRKLNKWYGNLRILSALNYI